MNVTEIPFVKLLDIKQEEQTLSLAYKNDVLNHVNTIHASAQFTLAETDSGLYLQKLFPELEGKVIPLLRDATIKYKKPAQEKIIAYSNVDEENLIKFREQFAKKGRGSIEVSVQVKDINDTLTAQARFTWFVQTIEL